MSKLTRALIIGASLTAMNLAGMTAVAQAQATNEGKDARRPPSERQVGESWRHGQVASPEPTAADAALKRVQAQERFSIPNATPAQTPTPVPPKPSRKLGWLIVSLAVLVAALVLAGGLAVLAAKRTRRRARLGHVT
jgi:hypothetical protein